MKKSVMMFFYFFCLLNYMYSQDTLIKQDEMPAKLSSYDPWYTGPLIADGGDNTGIGAWSFTHSIYALNTYGIYNSAWRVKTSNTELTINPTTSFNVGVNNWLEFKMFDLQAFYNHESSQSSFNVSDYVMRIGIQLMKENDARLRPAIRILLQETFPTGKYKNLSPIKNGIDSTGGGSYVTTIELAMSKCLYFFYNHPINFYVNLGYGIHSNVKVTGFNAYGGGFNASGTVKPGMSTFALLALEYSFTQKIAFAMDILYNYIDKTTFSGNPGTNLDGTIASNSVGSSQQLSLTPGLEYNFNKNIGLLLSSWFTVNGRNATDFAGGALLLTYYIGNS